MVEANVASINAHKHWAQPGVLREFVLSLTARVQTHARHAFPVDTPCHHHSGIARRTPCSSTPRASFKPRYVHLLASMTPPHTTTTQREWARNNAKPETALSVPQHCFEHLLVVGLPPTIDAAYLEEAAATNAKRTRNDIAQTTTHSPPTTQKTQMVHNATGSRAPRAPHFQQRCSTATRLTSPWTMQHSLPTFAFQRACSHGYWSAPPA